jgi:hypothetical protein
MVTDSRLLCRFRLGGGRLVVGQTHQERRLTKMPVKIRKKGKKYQVSTPNGVKAKGTTKRKAQKQANLLRGVEHGWKPTRRKKKKGK